MNHFSSENEFATKIQRIQHCVFGRHFCISWPFCLFFQLRFWGPTPPLRKEILPLRNFNFAQKDSLKNFQLNYWRKDLNVDLLTHFFSLLLPKGKSVIISGLTSEFSLVSALIIKKCVHEIGWSKCLLHGMACQQWWAPSSSRNMCEMGGKNCPILAHSSWTEEARKKILSRLAFPLISKLWKMWWLTWKYAHAFLGQFFLAYSCKKRSIFA